MRLLLIGKQGKRKEYFFKAAHAQKLEPIFLDIEDPSLLAKIYPNDHVKIDPIAKYAVRLNDLGEHIDLYKKRLNELQAIEKIHFLNTPKSILQTLDKRYCKKRLQQFDLAITPLLAFEGTNFDELLAFLRKERIPQVFVKPNFGSGAAGVIALKYNLKTEDLIAHTSLAKKFEEEKVTFVNTKKIRRLTGYDEIAEVINFVLSMDSIVERWIAKDCIGDISYDLRIVFQFGKIDFIQVRGARRTAITNLHLNDLPIDPQKIALKPSTYSEIEELCKRGIGCFEGLQSAGFDILIEKGSQKPYIIEINGQGDLMYRDIFDKNKIYQKQIEWFLHKENTNWSIE